MNRSGLLFRCRVLRPQIQRNVKKSLIWRQKGEGLSFLLGDTNKGPKDLADALACRQGVTLTVPYEKMNANFFAQLNKEPF